MNAPPPPVPHCLFAVYNAAADSKNAPELLSEQTKFRGFLNHQQFAPTALYDVDVGLGISDELDIFKLASIL